jgi:SAM-dependent methyltransferase
MFRISTPIVDCKGCARHPLRTHAGWVITQMHRKAHWDEIYESKPPEALTWFQESPRVSLQLFAAAHSGRESTVIDVGGGTARLVDQLINDGYEDVTVLDVSSRSLDRSRDRLGSRSRRVQWIVADILDATLPKNYDLWHDRAVFHFLTDADDRQRYADKLYESLASGGHAIISTFAEDGPERCSGLPCIRYSPQALHEELGARRFELIDAVYETHRTPGGKEQRFQYSLLRKK